MQKINLEAKGILVNLHRFFFIDLPKDTCTYKGHLIISLVAYILTLNISIVRSILFLFPKIRNNKDVYGVRTHVTLGFLMLLGFLIGMLFTENANLIPDYIYWNKLSIFSIFLMSFPMIILGLIICSIIIGLGLAIGYVIIKLVKLLEFLYNKSAPVINPTYINNEGKAETQIGVLYQSAKEKWCKQINWKE